MEYKNVEMLCGIAYCGKLEFTSGSCHKLTGFARKRTLYIKKEDGKSIKTSTFTSLFYFTLFP